MERLDDALSLEEVVNLRGVPHRDCRDCAQFTPDTEGRAFGWCSAHRFYVKLYHSEAEWHSQCQFKTLRLVRKVRRAAEAGADPAADAGAGAEAVQVAG